MLGLRIHAYVYFCQLRIRKERFEGKLERLRALRRVKEGEGGGTGEAAEVSGGDGREKRDGTGQGLHIHKSRTSLPSLSFLGHDINCIALPMARDPYPFTINLAVGVQVVSLPRALETSLESERQRLHRLIETARIRLR